MREEVEELTVGHTPYWKGQTVRWEGIIAKIQYLYDDGFAQINYNRRVRLVDVKYLETFNKEERI